MNGVEKAPTEIATRFNTLLSTFLESKSEVRKEVNTFYKHDPKFTKNLNEAKKLEKIARQSDNLTIFHKSHN